MAQTGLDFRHVGLCWILLSSIFLRSLPETAKPLLSVVRGIGEWRAGSVRP